MEKLLIYTNSWEDIKKVIPHYNSLKSSGYEVAFSTDSIELAKRLSIGKLLVVKPGTYTPSISVSNKRLKEYPEAISFNTFLGVMDNE